MLIIIMNNNNVNNKIYLKIVHNIRNSSKLTVEQIDYIKSLTSDEKMEIILLYEKVMEANRKLMEELLNTLSYESVVAS